MNEVLMQDTISTMDKAGNVILDIETLIQPLDKCCTGSPKLKKALSRKGSCRWDRRNGEEQEVDEAHKKLVVKVVPSQLEQLKQPLMLNKALIAVQSPSVNNAVRADSGDGKSKRLKSLITIHPRKILLLFATVLAVIHEAHLNLSEPLKTLNFTIYCLNTKKSTLVTGITFVVLSYLCGPWIHKEDSIKSIEHGNDDSDIFHPRH